MADAIWSPNSRKMRFFCLFLVFLCFFLSVLDLKVQELYWMSSASWYIWFRIKNGTIQNGKSNTSAKNLHFLQFFLVLMFFYVILRYYVIFNIHICTMKNLKQNMSIKKLKKKNSIQFFRILMVFYWFFLNIKI